MTIKKTSSLAQWSLMLFGLAGTAQAALFTNPYNPIVTHMYTADPTARVFNDRLFVYPSSDAICPEGKGSNGFCMPGYNVFSTQDLTHWTDHGNVVNHHSVPWVTPNSYGMWAPDTIEKDGKYYLYFPGISRSGEHFREIGVAVAEHPQGPFVAEPNYIKGLEGIDPGPFIDDDGRAYMYWGGGKSLKVVELNPDLKSVKGERHQVELINSPKGYVEGSFLFKRKGKYYFTYPHAPEGTEQISYAIGDNPMGPFTYKGKIMARWEKCFTNHHSVVKYQGQWYIFYHHMDLSGDKNLRSMAADRLYFDENGLIKEVKATGRGIGYVNASQTLQVDRFSSLEGAEVSTNIGHEVPNWVIQNIQPGAKTSFNDVDFGQAHYQDLVAMVQSAQPGAIIRVTDDTGKLVSTLKVPVTGKGQWQAIRVKLDSSPTGMRNLNLSYTGHTQSLKLDWLRFVKRDEIFVSLAGNAPGDAATYDGLELNEQTPHAVLSQATFNSDKLILSPQDATHSSQILINGHKASQGEIAKAGSVINLSFTQPAKIRYATQVLVPEEASHSYKTHPAPNSRLKFQGRNVPAFTYLKDGAFVTFDNILFDDKATDIVFSYAAEISGNTVQVREGDEKGKLLAELSLESTGGLKKWRTKRAQLNQVMPLGTTQITLVFKGKTQPLYHFGWFKFIADAKM